jgi:hypothetical protein
VSLPKRDLENYVKNGTTPAAAKPDVEMARIQTTMPLIEKERLIQFLSALRMRGKRFDMSEAIVESLKLWMKKMAADIPDLVKADSGLS